jgi:hypothetical protein
MRVDGAIIRILFLAFLASLTGGCDSSMNMNRLIFVGDKDEEATRALLEKARILYDRGDFAGALVYAQKSVDKNRDNEQGGILLGYIHMGLAGFEVFTIAERLIEMNQTKAGETSDNGCQSTSGADADQALDSFNCLFDISQADLFSLSEDSATNTADGKLQKSDNAYFDDLPILYPKTMPTVDNPDIVDPRDSVATLSHLKQAIQAICPFVDPPLIEGELSDSDVRLPDDPRHDCEPTLANRKIDTKGHFLWAIAHLLEAIAFNNILLYVEDSSATGLAEPASAPAAAAGGTSSNLLLRVAALNQTEFSGSEIADYVSAVDELSVNIGEVFDTSADSMLSVVLGNLQATVRAAGAAGIPENMIKSVRNALTKIEEAAAQLGGAGEDSKSNLSAQTEALKGKLNKSVTKNLASSIEKFAQSDGVTEDKVAEVCTKFDDISKGMPPSELATIKPASCN